MFSRITCKAFWTILSRGELIAKTLNCPGLFGLGIVTKRVGLNLKIPLFSSWAVFLNQSKSIPSRVSDVVPGDMFPALPLIIM